MILIKKTKKVENGACSVRGALCNPLLQLDHSTLNFHQVLFYCRLLECDQLLLLWVVQAFELELRREYTEHYLCKQVLLIFVYLTHVL